MRPEASKRNKKFHISKGLRSLMLAWSAIMGITAMLGAELTFAWYTLKAREAETTVANVMKPYYLSLREADGSDVLQLSIGSLLQGKTKQIVFCVSSEEAQQHNTDTAVFEYELELVHTDNLALKYELYPLVMAEVAEGDSTDGLIVTEHEVTGAYGEQETMLIYWEKTGEELAGTDVSAQRWVQAGLTEDSTDNGDIINSGTYISYDVSAESDDPGFGGEGLQLTAGEATAQYFVLEISWSISAGFDNYDKETDMIYLVAKAVQPEPEEQE